MIEETKVLLLFDNAEEYINLFKIKGLSFYTLSGDFNKSEIEGVIVFHSKDLKRINPDEFINLKIIKTLTAGTDHIDEY